MAASLVRSACSWVLTCAWSAVTLAIRLSSRDTCFSASKICWPSAIRLNSDWFSDFSSISAWASDAVRAPINWPWASRFCSVGPADGGLAPGDGVTVVLFGVGVTAGLGVVDAGGGAPGTAASTPVGATSNPSITARLSRRTATLGPRRAPAATEWRDFTALQKSLQVFRRGPLRPAPSNPKRCLRGPFLPGFVFDAAPRAPVGAKPHCAPFSHFCHPLPACTFRGSPPGHLPRPNLCYHPEKPTRAITGEVIWHRAGFLRTRLFC